MMTKPEKKKYPRQLRFKRIAMYIQTHEVESSNCVMESTVKESTLQ